MSSCPWCPLWFNLIFFLVAFLAPTENGWPLAITSERFSALQPLPRSISASTPIRFDGRILPIGQGVAHTCRQVVHKVQNARRPIAVIEAFLAATALFHGLVLVTRNEADFRAVSKRVVNPWLF